VIVTLTLCFASGFAVGRWGPRFEGSARRIARIQGMVYSMMLFVLGARLGIHLFESRMWSDSLVRSLILMGGSVVGSFLFLYPIRTWIDPESEEDIRLQTAHLPNLSPHQIVGQAVLSLTVGAIVGTVMRASLESVHLERLALALLCSLVVLIGIDSGRDEEAGDVLSSLKLRLVFVPILIGIGSIIGASVAGVAMGLSPRDGGAVGAGCGWYSLTTLLLGDLEGPRLASYGLLANLFREALAIVLIPLVARVDRGLLLLAAPGCSAMDSTLPLLGRLGGNRIGVMAFITGAFLSLLVPILVPWSYRLLP